MSALQQIDEQFEVDLLLMKVDVLASFAAPVSFDDASLLPGKYSVDFQPRQSRLRTTRLRPLLYRKLPMH
jgi:hypothetical protein